MSENKKTVQQYLAAFNNKDHAAILACLTDDVEWVLPGVYHHKGKEAFDKEIENEGFTGKPEITETRMIEENDIVVAEGTVKTRKADGEYINLVFCDVFEMKDTKIRKLTSYLMQVAAL